MRAGGAPGSSVPQGPRCPLSTGLPMASQPGPWAAFLSGSWPCSHVVSTYSTHRPIQDRRTGQTCPPAPAPLFPDPSERKRESCVSMRGCRSPVGSSISVSARVRLGAQGRVSMLRQTGAVRRPQCPPAGTGSQASSTPPTVRSSRGLKKEDSYPRGSTCKEHLALLGFLERERR